MQALHRERVIDIPIESLPFVDDHSTTIAASLEATWDALLATCSRHGVAAPLARALGCEHSERRGPPDRIGSTIPGFVVARSVPPCVLALMGAHRFSVYALVFRLTEAEGEGDRVQLRAETRAEFPGATGRVYRIAVIGSHGHVVATRSILRAVRRRAEGSPPRWSPLRSRPGSAD